MLQKSSSKVETKQKFKQRQNKIYSIPEFKMSKIVAAKKIFMRKFDPQSRCSGKKLLKCKLGLVWENPERKNSAN